MEMYIIDKPITIGWTHNIKYRSFGKPFSFQDFKIVMCLVFCSIIEISLADLLTQLFW